MGAILICWTFIWVIKIILMELYSQRAEYKLYHWNMLDMCEVIESWTIDSIVTDPPYWLTTIVKRFGKENSAPCKEWKDGRFARLSRWFMGKERDWSWIEYNIDAWRKCYEVLKPWWYLLAFGWSRTYHRIACAIEDAWFEIRDCIMRLYGSWFPKSLNIWSAIDKKNWDWDKWEWWWTALKPSYEPIVVARKPLEWSCVDNVLKYWVGGINIDECRVWNNGGTKKVETESCTDSNGIYGNGLNGGTVSNIDSWRYPANTILTYWEDDKEEVCRWFPDTKNTWKPFKAEDYSENGIATNFTRWDFNPYNDEWSASRYYYTAKATNRDRDEWLQEFETKSHAEINNRKEWSAWAERAYWWGTNPYLSVSSPRKNIHPTVKPCDLMQYLIRLVTPKWWIVLDPFNWSGSTWKAVMYENKDRNKWYKYIWIELTDEYLPISKARIEYVINGWATTETIEIKHDWIIKQWDQISLFINK